MEFIDLKKQYKSLKSEIDNNIQDVLNSAQFIGGKYVVELESQLAEHTNRKYCITCANGTDALQVAYMAYNIGKGDAVFCTDITFIASTEPAKMLGATPVFCDCTKDTYNICPESLEKQIKAVIDEGRLKPAAVVAVDELGNPCDYDRISAICDKYGLVLIEDAAQSFGASYKGIPCGKFGNIATTSFFPAKPLGCYGDGGAIFTDDDEIAALCRQICIHGKGSKGKYDNVIVGVNSRLDSLQAAILLPKLKALKSNETALRQKIATRYNEAFANKLQIPYVADECVSIFAQYAVLANNEIERNKIVKYLSEKNIPNMIYYPTPQHQLPVFAEENAYGECFENAIDYCSRTFSLPMHPYLESEEQEEVIKAVLEVISEV